MPSWSFIPNALRGELEVSTERSSAVGPARQREAVCVSWKAQKWDFGLAKVGDWEGSCRETLMAFWPDLYKATSGVARDKDVPLMVPWLPQVLQGHGAVPAQPLPQCWALTAPFWPQGLKWCHRAWWGHHHCWELRHTPAHQSFPWIVSAVSQRWNPLRTLNIPFSIVGVPQLRGSPRARPTWVKPREAQNVSVPAEKLPEWWALCPAELSILGPTWLCFSRCSLREEGCGSAVSLSIGPWCFPISQSTGEALLERQQLLQGTSVRREELPADLRGLSQVQLCTESAWCSLVLNNTEAQAINPGKVKLKTLLRCCLVRT